MALPALGAIAYYKLTAADVDVINNPHRHGSVQVPHASPSTPLGVSLASVWPMIVTEIDSATTVSGVVFVHNMLLCAHQVTVGLGVGQIVLKL